ncbi:MAG: response regulator [Polyangiaceae bacterium]
MTSKRLVVVGTRESNVVRLRRALRTGGREWSVIAFATPADALAELQRSHADAVACELRLAGSDGPGFLDQVKKLSPQSVRFVIGDSGDTKNNVVIVQAAHQVLPNGCSDDTLREAVERTARLNELISNNVVRSAVGGMDRLPSVPKTYWALMRAAGRPDTSMTDIAKIVESDPAMAAKVLQLVNSAFFGLARRVTSIQQAVRLLGLDLLKGLVLSAHVFATFENAHLSGFNLEMFQQYSVRVANLAKRFLGDHAHADEAFAAGLVHDLGKLIIALRFPTEFAGIARLAASSPLPYHRVEFDSIGTTHAELGGYLLGVWGLPFTIVEAVAFHHSPTAALLPSNHKRAAASSQSADYSVLAAIHAADALVGILSCGEGEDRLELEFFDRAGLASELPKWRDLAAADAQRGQA